MNLKHLDIITSLDDLPEYGQQVEEIMELDFVDNNVDMECLCDALYQDYLHLDLLVTEISENGISDDMVSIYGEDLALFNISLYNGVEVATEDFKSKKEAIVKGLKAAIEKIVNFFIDLADNMVNFNRKYYKKLKFIDEEGKLQDTSSLDNEDFKATEMTTFPYAETKTIITAFSKEISGLVKDLYEEAKKNEVDKALGYMGYSFDGNAVVRDTSNQLKLELMLLDKLGWDVGRVKEQVREALSMLNALSKHTQEVAKKSKDTWKSLKANPEELRDLKTRLSNVIKLYKVMNRESYVLCKRLIQMTNKMKERA